MMRSRYAAFALGNAEYLAATQVAPLDGLAALHWAGLTVHDATDDQVEFTARYVDGDREVSLRERSRFERRDGRWLYVCGEPQLSARRVGRNEPCPCGSGKKLKACAR
jgi:SEC-C motif-containing protein